MFNSVSLKLDEFYILDFAAKTVQTTHQTEWNTPFALSLCVFSLRSFRLNAEVLVTATYAQIYSKFKTAADKKPKLAKYVLGPFRLPKVC